MGDLFKSGPELDLAVHLKVFQAGQDQEVHPFSTQDAWAAIVVKKMRSLGWNFIEQTWAGKQAGTLWKARFDLASAGGGLAVFGAYESESRPFAICMAAIFAIQSKAPAAR